MTSNFIRFEHLMFPKFYFKSQKNIFAEGRKILVISIILPYTFVGQSKFSDDEIR